MTGSFGGGGSSSFGSGGGGGAATCGTDGGGGGAIAARGSDGFGAGIGVACVACVGGCVMTGCGAGSAIRISAVGASAPALEGGRRGDARRLSRLALLRGGRSAPHGGSVLGRAFRGVRARRGRRRDSRAGAAPGAGSPELRRRPWATRRAAEGSPRRRHRRSRARGASRRGRRIEGVPRPLRATSAARGAA